VRFEADGQLRQAGVRVAARQFEGLRPQAIKDAYARLSKYYDISFGPLLAQARQGAVQAVNALPGRDVLEVGVGTGLALPHYGADKRIIGIDVSADMLAKARARAAKLANVQAVLEMDAQASGFADGQFDIAVAMFVASVVPNPKKLLAEMRRIVKPGGTLLFVNHFAEEDGVPEWWRRVTETISAKIGWRADFRMRDIFDADDISYASIVPMRPFGFFDLVELRN
jgi:phosphatidylethanolamine/phosphatidyl-N-methylethanolamine N-methyltransferase